MRLIEKTKGAISIFLCIILTATVCFTGVLIDGTRIRAGNVQVHAALDIGAMSALAEYNQLLKEQYGLFALSENNPEILEDAVSESMNQNLMTALGTKKQSLYDQVYQEVSNFITGKPGQKEKPSWNLFDYIVEDVKVNPMYNLSEHEVMKNQIVQYMKYRAPKVLAEEFIDKIDVFKDISKQTAIMKEKTKLDKQLVNVRKSQERLSDRVEVINDFGVGPVNENVIMENIDIFMQCMAEKMMLEKKKAKLEEEKKVLIQAQQTLEDEINQIKSKEQMLAEDKSTLDIKKKALTEKKERIKGITQSITILGTQVGQQRSSAINAKQKIQQLMEPMRPLLEGALNDIADIRKKAKDANQQIQTIQTKIGEDKSDFAKAIQTETKAKKTEIDEKNLKEREDALRANIQVIEALQVAISQLDTEGVLSDTLHETAYEKILPRIKEILAYSKLESILRGYHGRINQHPIAYRVQKGDNKKKPEDPRDDAKKIAKEEAEKSKKEQAEAKKKENEMEEKYPFPKELLPSTGNSGKVLTEKDASLFKMLQGDEQYVDTLYHKMLIQANEVKDRGIHEGGLSEADLGEASFDDKSDYSEKALDVLGGLGDMLGKGLSDMRDTLYVNEYILGNLKNTLSKQSKERYFNDMTKILEQDGKPTRNTYFENEVEYILGGSSSDSHNKSFVKTNILLIRFALNTIHIYTDPQKSNLALQTATALVGFSGFLVPVVHTLIMLGWSMAESVLDVSLIMGGTPMPIMKTNKTWMLGGVEGFKKVVDEIKKALGEKAKEMTNKVVDYTAQSSTQLVTSAQESIHEIIEGKINVAIEQAFSTVEKNLRQAVEQAEITYSEVANSIEKAMDHEGSTLLEQVDYKIQEEMPTLFEQVMEKKTLNDQGIEESFRHVIDGFTHGMQTLEQAYTDSVMGQTKSKITKIRAEIDQKKEALCEKMYATLKEAKRVLMEDIFKKIDQEVKALKEDINKNIEALAKTSKEKVGAYIDGLTGKNKAGAPKTNLKSSLLSMDYQGYLRLLLLMTNENKKLSRLQDLIQLNINVQKESRDFMISDCNTYLRVEAEVTMKYFFMTQPFMPSRLKRNGRHKLVATVYKGY